MKKKLSLLLQKIRNSKFFKIFFSSCLIFAVLLSCVVIPSSAEEVSAASSDVPNNLTGYRIKFPFYSELSVPFGYGIFDLDCNLYGAGIYSQFCVGYSLDPSSTNLYNSSYTIIPSADSFCSLVSRSSSGVNSGKYVSLSNHLTSDTYVRWMDVDGGYDADNPRLIDFLVSYGCSFVYIGVPSGPDGPSYVGDTFQSIAPIHFSNFSGNTTAIAFTGPHSLALNVNADSGRNYLDNSDYHLYDDIIKTKLVDGQPVPYIKITLRCNYASVTRNDVYYSGTFSSSDISGTLSGVTSFEVYPVEHSYNADVTYYYTWDILLGNFFNYDDVYIRGFEDGVNSVDARELYFYEGYDLGFSDGLNSSASGSLGANLLGDTLSAPMKALNNFIIYETSSGFDVTLGGVVGAAISLTLFIAFLKIFAGG